MWGLWVDFWKMWQAHVHWVMSGKWDVRIPAYGEEACYSTQVMKMQRLTRAQSLITSRTITILIYISNTFEYSGTQRKWATWTLPLSIITFRLGYVLLVYKTLWEMKREVICWELHFCKQQAKWISLMMEHVAELFNARQRDHWPWHSVSAACVARDATACTPFA